MEILGVSRNVSFGLKSLNNNAPTLTLVFEVCLLNVPQPVPIAYQGEELNNFLKNWQISDVRLLEKLPVVVDVEQITPNDPNSMVKFTLVKPFLV